MPKKPGANLYKDAASWPVIPPWWLLSTTQAAALINVTPATLHYWRTRGEGPASVPPLFLKPTQGDPIFYVYAVLRSWAAERVGIQYAFEDQCSDFFLEVIPGMESAFKTVKAKAQTFDQLHASSRKKVGKGENPSLVDRATVLRLDPYYAKQPKWRRRGAKYEWENLGTTMTCV